MNTTDPCPQCGMPAECQHGLIINGRRAHIWNCRACGEQVAILGYDCADCARARAAEQEEQES